MDKMNLKGHMVRPFNLENSNTDKEVMKHEKVVANLKI